MNKKEKKYIVHGALSTWTISKISPWKWRTAAENFYFLLYAFLDKGIIKGVYNITYRYLHEYVEFFQISFCDAYRPTMGNPWQNLFHAFTHQQQQQFVAVNVVVHACVHLRRTYLPSKIWTGKISVGCKLQTWIWKLLKYLKPWPSQYFTLFYLQNSWRRSHA